MAQTDGITKIDNALAEYYKRLNKPYFNDDGVGKYAEYMEENGLEEDDLEDEMSGGVEDCTSIEFDEEFPFNPPIQNENKRNEEILKILQHCYKTGKPPPPKSTKVGKMDLNKLKLKKDDVTSKVIDAAVKRYKSQTPEIIEACAKEPDVIHFLSARDVNNNLAFLSNMVDAFTRDRAIAKCRNAEVDAPSVKKWCAQNPWIKQLAQTDKNLADSLEAAIKGFGKRISPFLQFNPLVEIDDSIEQIGNYLVLASNFIDNLINNQKGVPPFQVDVTIAVRKIALNAETPAAEITDSDDTEEEEEEEDKEDEPDAGGDNIKIGDFYKKIKHEKLSHVEKDVDEQKETKDSVRKMMDHFNEFKRKMAENKSKNQNKKDPMRIHTEYNENSYPHKKRFNIFIDRRGQKDKMTFFEPPHVCDTIPKKNHVPEWYFETVRKCIIPRIGFGDGTKESVSGDKKDPENTTITSQSAVGGSLLTFSFHVESSEEIKCYMFWMAQGMRFYPKDLIQTFQFLFTSDEYKSFVESNKYESLAAEIKISDPKYESFYNGLNQQSNFFRGQK